MSALSVSLASRGGYQGKQGYLRILSKSSRKSEQPAGLLAPIRWVKAQNPKWFIVRESYIAMVDEPDSLQIYDVFLIDNDFEIIRPRRLYRQTISLASSIKDSAKKDDADDRPDDESGNKADEKDMTALLTNGNFKGVSSENDKGEEQGPEQEKGVSAHTFYIKNSERKLKLVAKTERLMNQFIASMEAVAARNVFKGSNRFDSFAPIRLNCSARWLVDGRDYFWNLSKALLMASSTIIIHDWWLSPELYLRRPGQLKYRLDHILKKKAEEGVKIFVIIYNEVSNNFTPTDSNYTKQRLIGLHRNIYVQRSPSHFQTGTFYWAHHEKMCVIDETIAFMGGLDLCFGRWDTAAHVLVDDVELQDEEGEVYTDSNYLGPVRNGAEAQIWPGQDYANERVMEWHDLSKPEKDLFARDKFPRMPWHDVGLQIVGQPARDLCRHFIQRWNYLLRIKNHSRVMPFLVPPPDFTPQELTKYGLVGTCEAQICRSAGPWSLGTSSKIEHSIQNAYLKAIQMSEHFVYIENQFFISSTTFDSTKIENQIGDALVNRIIRAHREDTPWRAVIVMPLVPGFPMPIDHPDASSVRLIVECQYRSICRGESSIFARLRREGIAPEDYIQFFSLRTWSKLRGGLLTTEQIYPHDKIMVVDDRLAIIGSANINERSQRGDRDSELACVIRDTDMIDSTMGGEPYKVGRFPHTFRVRLMREHLGIDVDELDADPMEGSQDGSDDDVSVQNLDGTENEWDPDDEQTHGDEQMEGATVTQKDRGPAHHYADTFARTFENAKVSKVASAASGMIENKAKKITSRTKDDNDAPEDTEMSKEQEEQRAAMPDMHERMDSIISGKDLPRDLVPTVEEQVMASQVSEAHAAAPAERTRSRAASVSSRKSRDNATAMERSASRGSNLSDTQAGVKRKMSTRFNANPWASPGEAIDLDPDCFEDPLCDDFYEGKWMAIATRNTQIYRKVFKCVPDDTVTTWSEYKAFLAWSDRLSRSQMPTHSGKTKLNDHVDNMDQKYPDHPGMSGSRRSSTSDIRGKGDGKRSEKEKRPKDKESEKSSDRDQTTAGGPGAPPLPPSSARPGPLSTGADGAAGTAPSSGGKDTEKKTEGGGASVDPGFSPEELQQMETLLEQTQGHLVVFSTRWLEKESASGNLLFPSDALLPLNVYD